MRRAICRRVPRAALAVRAVLALNGSAVLALGVVPNALIQLCARVIG